jgi:hypothetical protein
MSERLPQKVLRERTREAVQNLSDPNSTRSLRALCRQFLADPRNQLEPPKLVARDE